MTRVWIIATLICVTAAAVAFARGGEPAVETNATLSWTDEDGGVDHFDGALESEKRKCEKRRRVVLFRRVQGEDEKVERAESNREGSFLLEHEDPGSGRYFVKVNQERRGATLCGAVRTGLLEITDLEGV